MAKKRLTPQDRIALDNWNELVASVREHSDINPTDTETEIRQRRERLEKNDEEWFKYYFAMYCTCESAAFHKKATGRMMRNSRWYEVRAWSRELAKSARSMMEISKLALTKKIRNVLLISNSAENAERRTSRRTSGSYRTTDSRKNRERGKPGNSPACAGAPSAPSEPGSHRAVRVTRTSGRTSFWWTI